MLLPKIAVLYRCSIDSLFNMESSWDEGHQKEFKAKIDQLYRAKDYKGAYHAWLTEIELNPDNFSYYASLMHMVFFQKLLDDRYIKRMLMLAEHAEKYCFDTDIKNEIYLRMLMICSNAKSGAFQEQALNFYHKLPKLRHSRELLEYMISAKESGEELTKKNIMLLATQLEWEIRKLIRPEQSANEKLLYYQKAEAVFLIMLDEKYGGVLDAQLLSIYTDIISLLIEMRREREARTYIDKILYMLENHISEDKRTDVGLLCYTNLPYDAEGIVRMCTRLISCLESASRFETQRRSLVEKLDQYQRVCFSSR